MGFVVYISYLLVKYCIYMALCFAIGSQYVFKQQLSIHNTNNCSASLTGIYTVSTDVCMNNGLSDSAPVPCL